MGNKEQTQSIRADLIHLRLLGCVKGNDK